MLTMEARTNEVATYEAAGDYDSARAILAAVCDMYAAAYTDYHPETISCMVYSARLERETGSPDEAERILKNVVANLDKSTTRVDSQALDALIQVTEIYRIRGEYQAAKDLLSGLIGLAQQIGETELSYTGKSYLSRILASQGETEAARVISEDIVRYGEQNWQDRPVQYYSVLIELAAILQRQSKFAEAETLLREAVETLVSIVGVTHPTTLVAMSNLGLNLEQQGLYDEAEPIMKQTVAGMEETFGIGHEQTSIARNNLALLHESQGNFREAEPLYLTSYGFFSEEFGQQHPNALAVQNNLAFLYMLMEEYEQAEEMFGEVVAMWNEVLGTAHQDTLKGLNNLGRVQHRLGKLDEAVLTVSTALETRRSSLGENHVDSIRSQIDLGAILLDLERLEEAEAQLRDALARAEATVGEQHPYTFEALNNLARVLEAKGDLGASVELREVGLARRSTFLDRMLWVTGENAREGYIRLHRPELDEYLALLTRVDDPHAGKKAIEANLQRKGLLLKVTSEIEQISQLSSDPKLASISADLEEARKELAALTLSGPTAETQGRHTEFLYELERKVNELQGELGRASARYRSTIANVDADMLTDSLDENSALVDFLMYNDAGDDKVLAGIILNEDGDLSYDLVVYDDRGALETAVLEYREIIQDDLADDDEVMEIGMEAFDAAWAPVEEALGGLEYVYLVPDGVLNILPFNALMNEDEEYLIQTTDLHILTSGRDLLPNVYDLAQGEYVILAGPDYNANNVVSAEELAVAADRRSSALKLGIRGSGSGLRGLNFAPLPGAEEEGRIITTQVEAKEESSDVYFGERAQEQVLASINEAPEILHMATHGFFLEADDTLRKRLLKMQRGAELQVPPPGDNPLLRAGLAFAGINSNAQFLGDIDTVNDGVLTALEVLGLNLSGTKLVVLSACETGLGEIHEGEGVYGLRRSFQEAGVAEVISSLWEVSDAGTQALMTDFYDRVLEGVPAREALRETQLALIDSPEWGYPYIWSAFMIVGSYESAGITIQ